MDCTPMLIVPLCVLGCQEKETYIDLNDFMML
jgi:hypothetical protein